MNFIRNPIIDIMTHSLFAPFQMGSFSLTNRIVMAPLTRRHAENPELTANDLIAEHYRQRATAGLIISEGSQISEQAYGYTHSPGCHTKAQIEAWKKVTRAVHEAGGHIFLQLWHVGPFSHPLLQPGQRSPLSASAVKPEGQVLTPHGRLPYETSRAMSREDIRQTIRDFAAAALSATEAGFDGVEVHGAHAYLIDQFIMDGTNHRTDEYGGSLENRARLLFELLEAISEKIPLERTGLRLSPGRMKSGMADSKAEKTYGYIVERLNDYPLAYLHLSEMMEPEERLLHPQKSIVPFYRKLFRGTLISCGGHSRASALRMIDEQEADMIAFGKLFISNPDLPRRLSENLPLAGWDNDTFYHGGSRGYNDYPPAGI